MKGQGDRFLFWLRLAALFAWLRAGPDHVGDQACRFQQANGKE